MISFLHHYPHTDNCIEVGGNRCALSYRRCETSVTKMLEMINVELEEIEGIQKEVDNGVISVEDIQNR